MPDSNDRGGWPCLADEIDYTVAKMQTALEAAGVEFIDENGDDAGARLR